MSMYLIEDPAGSDEFRLADAATGVEVIAGGDLITLAAVVDRAPDLSPDDQAQLHAELNAAARRIAPCLAADTATTDQLVEARGILIRAVVRAGAVESWVESITTGPYGTKFRATTGTSSILTSADEAALRALCGGTSDSLVPLGSFPAAGSYDRLFATPRY